MTLKVQSVMYRLPEQPPIGTIVKLESGHQYQRTNGTFWHTAEARPGTISFGFSWGQLLGLGPVEVVPPSGAAADPIGTVRCSHAPAYLAVTNPGVTKRRWVEIGTGDRITDSEAEEIPVAPRETLARFLSPEDQ